ncbi:putative Cinnamoyl-CoA reductase 2 [Cocos nucifera]|uniref:Putative Cinnamoyl-CoA reductase 2 n=1 Tax=Cocos nucifera TaxID=13894 RepID=A0A8K0MZU3_COCNU|nr:putative Cinnamoyl-CoA reductase 2 [Cocos nucifera]
MRDCTCLKQTCWKRALLIQWLRAVRVFFIQHLLSMKMSQIHRCSDDKPFVPIYQVSKEKAKSLGIDYIPLETSIKETVESWREKGFGSF